MSYITAEEVDALWRTMTVEELERTESLIPGIEDQLKSEASRRGKDLDYMLASGDLTSDQLKLVIAGIVVRTLSADASGVNDLISNQSQSGLGYSESLSFVSTGGGLIRILDSDLKRLGLLRQRYGALDIYGVDGEDA